MKISDLAICIGLAAMDPDPEPANPRWAEALLDEAKGDEKGGRK